MNTTQILTGLIDTCIEHGLVSEMYAILQDAIKASNKKIELNKKIINNLTQIDKLSNGAKFNVSNLAKIFNRSDYEVKNLRDINRERRGNKKSHK